MVYQGALILGILLGCFHVQARPREILEADALVRGGKYRVAAIYFNQYRRLIKEHEAYCTERTAYCLMQTGEIKRAIKLLRDFGRGGAAAHDPEHTRCRMLLARLYLWDGEPEKALRVLEENLTFATHTERNLYILERLSLKRDLHGLKLPQARRILLAGALLSPPDTPGRLTMLRKFVEYGDDNLSIEVEKIIKRDYPNSKFQETK